MEFSVKGICVHNTSNEKSAKENELLFKKLQQMGAIISVHFIVDENEIIQLTPLNQMTFHTGKGYDFGNEYTISIEICRNFDDKLYEQAEAKAIELIKQLMIDYQLTSDDIYFHRDFDETTDCPRGIIYKYTKAEWIAKHGLDKVNNEGSDSDE